MHTICCDAHAARMSQQLSNSFDCFGPWAGWRMRGRFLISPHRDRLTPERLAGIVFVESLRRYREKETIGKPVCRVAVLLAGQIGTVRAPCTVDRGN